MAPNYESEEVETSEEEEEEEEEVPQKKRRQKAWKVRRLWMLEPQRRRVDRLV